jgi:hypothetical protein
MYLGFLKEKPDGVVLAKYLVIGIVSITLLGI